MVNSVIQFTIVIDLVLSVLVTTSCSKAHSSFLVLERCRPSKEFVYDELSFHADVLFLVEVGNGAVKRRENY